MSKKLSSEQQRALQRLTALLAIPDHLGINADGEPTEIQLFQRGVTDQDMECFRHFTEFELIGVGGSSGVTDAGLKYLAHLRKLTFLDLQDTGVTDAGLVHLAGIVSLRHLEGLGRLKKLVINEEGISNEAYERLLAAIPGLEISSY